MVHFNEYNSYEDNFVKATGVSSCQLQAGIKWPWEVKQFSSVQSSTLFVYIHWLGYWIMVGLWCFGLYNHVIFLLRFKGHLLQDQAGFPHSHWFSVFASLSSDHRIVEAKHVSHHHKIMGFTSWMTLTLVAGSKVSIFTHRPIPFEPSFEWSWTATHQMILQRHSSSAYDPSVKVKSSQVNPPI